MSRRSTLPNALRRTLGVAFGCLALMALGLPAVAPAADEIAWMYDPDAVVEIRLGGLSEEELDALEADPDEYQNGTFELRVNGVMKGLPLVGVGIRRKGGFGSSRPIKTGKSGLKVRFDEFVDDQLFFGIKRLTLNNMVQDPSMLHENLTYELFKEMGLPASRTGYAFIRLNGQAYGVFLNIETLDEISLPGWFESTQHLYEADAPGTDVREGEAGTFEVDEGDDEDISDLEALIEATNDEEGDWSDGMAGVADLEQMTRMWAVERYVGHWDGYAGVAALFRPNNYYLHSDASGLFTMVPWGTDQTWETLVEFDEEAGGRLFNYCFENTSCKALYVEALEDVLAKVVTLEFGRHAAERAELLAPCQALEEEERREYTGTEIEEGVDEALDFIADRPAELAAWLGLPSIEPVGEDPPSSLGGDPCSPPAPTDPEPGPTPLGPTPLGPTPPPGARKLWIGPARAKGATVATHLNVPGAGVAVQRVRARFDGRRRTVCKGRRSSGEPGPLTVRCRLSGNAVQRLELGPLKLHVRVGFTPNSGEPRFVARRLILAKSP